MGQPAKVLNTSFRIVFGGPGAGPAIDGFRFVFLLGVVSRIVWVGSFGSVAKVDHVDSSPSGARAARGSITEDCLACSVVQGHPARASPDPHLEPGA